jgi:hypothetical protein
MYGDIQMIEAKVDLEKAKSKGFASTLAEKDIKRGDAARPERKRN